MTINRQQRIAEARELLDVCCHLPLDLKQLAQRTGLSRWYFLRAFQRQFGITPHQYMLQRRIEKAKALLAYSNISVTEVCLAVGFQSLGTFSATFHRLVGCSPTEHRRRTEEQKQQLYQTIPGCFFQMLGFGKILSGEPNAAEQ
ncbi:MAG: helix-turn-helix transcriptional regulator [Anaerolineae bacterium]|nr:helix-turn-helix transcriptional regulator [Anaerolineae bacterium]